MELTSEKDSPPPEPTPPPAPALPADVVTDPTRRALPKADAANMTGTPSPYIPSAPVPTPSPSPYGQHFPQPRPIATASQPSVHHLQPPAAAAHPVVPSPGHVPQSPHYPSHSYASQQYTAVPAAAHHQVPTRLAPAYDHHRMAPAPAALTPVRPVVPPAPSSAAMAHPGPTSNAYHPPRAPEVYTLPDNMDAAIPPEVRNRFHRNDRGRVLFFTAPSIRRSDNGVLPEYASLGHSVHYLNGLDEFRKERRRKRQERDEALADVAQKKAALEAKEREESRETLLNLTEQSIEQFVERANAGNEALYANLGGWSREVLVDEEKHRRAEATAINTD